MKQIRQIANSIQTFGFTNPVLIDAENTILAGHGRVAAAKGLSMPTVPCVRLEHMTPEQKRAYVLADNKLALNAGWDEQLLAEELGALMTLDLDFNVEITGFSIPEIDGLIEGLEPEEPGDPRDDILPDPQAVSACCQPGDLWRMGRHRLLCGNALDADAVALRMDELALHPTVKPVQMIADAVKDVSGRGEIVLDLFGGSGSTMIAAEKTGRRAFLMELDPVYCDCILQRWETYAKDEAQLLICGLPVQEMA